MERKRELTHKLTYEITFEIFLPIFIVLILWLPYTYIFKMSHVYERIFASSDLILLSAIFFTSSAGTIFFETNYNRVKSKAEYLFWPMILFSIITFLIFASCKYMYIGYKFPDQGMEVEKGIKVIANLALGFIAASALTLIACKSFFYEKK